MSRPAPDIRVSTPGIRYLSRKRHTMAVLERARTKGGRHDYKSAQR